MTPPTSPLLFVLDHFYRYLHQDQLATLEADMNALFLNCHVECATRYARGISTNI